MYNCRQKEGLMPYWKIMLLWSQLNGLEKVWAWMMLVVALIAIVGIISCVKVIRRERRRNRKLRNWMRVQHVSEEDMEIAEAKTFARSI